MKNIISLLSITFFALITISCTGEKSSNVNVATDTLVDNNTSKTNQSSNNYNEEIPNTASNNGGRFFAKGMGEFPETSERVLNNNDLHDMQSEYWNKIMRNEIFARHGYIFKTADMKKYFNKQSWYKPLYDDVSNDLSSIEKQNIAIIKSME